MKLTGPSSHPPSRTPAGNPGGRNAGSRTAAQPGTAGPKVVPGTLPGAGADERAHRNDAPGPAQQPPAEVPPYRGWPVLVGAQERVKGQTWKRSAVTIPAPAAAG